MERLCGSTHARLTEPMRRDLESAFAELEEEQAKKSQVMKETIEKLFNDIQSLEEEKKSLHQQSVTEKEKFQMEMVAFRQAEQRKSQATIEEVSATFKEANMESLKEMERKEANLRSLMSKMRQDHEEKEKFNKLMNEALMKEIENQAASRSEQLKKMKVEYEAAAHTINLQLKEKNEQLLRLEKGRSKFLAAIDMMTQERENLTLSGAMNTAMAKQRLVSELKSHAETWVFGNTSSRPSVAGHLYENAPNVFLKWKIRDDWRKLQVNQAFLNDDLQTFALSKEIEAEIQPVIAAEDKITQKYKAKLEKIRNEAQQKETKLAQAKLKELAKLEKKKREIIEKMHKAEQKEQRKRQLKEKKQREENEKKEAKEQKKAEAMRRHEAKRAERDRRLQEESPGVRRRFFRACF